MQISPYKKEYEDQIIDLILYIQRNEFGIEITANDQPDLKNIKNYYQNGTGNFWIALIDGKVIGTISLFDIGNYQAALRKMFVHSNYRGSAYGVSKKLLSQLLAWSKKAKVKEIYLGTTSKFLAAHRFYEKNNFKEVDKLNLPEAFPIMVVDSKFYKYAI